MHAIQLIISTVGIFVLASFIPLTAISFYKYRLPRKSDEYEQLIQAIGHTGDNGPAYIPTINKEYSAIDYVLPVTFATLITLLFSTVMIMGPRLIGIKEVSLLLSGPDILRYDLAGNNNNLNLKLQGMLIISMAFSGAYIWSIQNLFRRLSIIDLPPSAYYGLGVRILFAIFVAMMVYYLSASVKSEPVPSASLPVFAFLAGMFPQRALNYIQERVQFPTKNTGMNSNPLPLNMIEGINMFQRVRLAEIGIDNGQNLAKYNILEFILRTPFSPRQIIDWIGQARLYLHFTSDIANLRKAGIRTIFDFKTIGADDNMIKNLSTDTGISVDRLKFVNTIISEDHDIANLEDVANKLLCY
jgi:hypothetical protein